MSEKKPVSMIVTDIDNTISDFFNNWGAAWDTGIGKLAESRGMKKDDLYDDIRNNAGGYARFHNFPDLLKETPSLSLENMNRKERRRLEKSDAKICHEVAKQYHEGNKMYEGVLATLRKAKTAGTKIVLYTDSPASGAIARMADMKYPLDLLDGLVCRADCTCEQNEVTGKYQFKKAPLQVAGATYNKYRDELVAKLGDKLVMNAGDVWKPNTQVMENIMKTHGATPETTVMVGDNIKSDGGAVRTGCHFAWQKAGSEVSDLTQEMYGKINDKADYKLGSQTQLETLKNLSMADPALGKLYADKMVVLESGFKDLNKHFQFCSAEWVKYNGKVEDKAFMQAAVARRVAGR